MAKRKYTYVDFREETGTPCFADVTNAVATSADNQVDYTRINGQLFDWRQGGAAGTAVMPVVRASAPLGWQIPGLDGGTTNFVEMGEGRILTTHPAPKVFTVGTDPAFFVRARLSVLGNIDNVTVAAVGFRTSTAFADTTSEATLGSAYNDMAFVGVTTTAGAMKSSVCTGGGAAVLTAATHAAISVAGTATTGIDFRVNVSSAGVCTFLIDGTEDTALNAVAAASRTIAGAVVPAIVVVVANGTGAVECPVVIQEYECGYQNI